MFNTSIFNLKKGAYIVTGGLGFLGKAHCHAIAAFGGTPIVLDITDTNVDELKEEIYSLYNIDLITYKADITSKESLKNICNQISTLMPIRGLVNNAARNPKVESSGLESSSRLENFSLEEWNLDINVCLTGAFLCTQIFGSHMSSKEGGSIINISSDLGLISPKQSLYFEEGKQKKEQPVKPVTYSVVKSGLIGLTRYTSTYWPENVRCNCLCPGGVYNNQSPIFLDKVKNEIPMSRLANVNEYGGIIVYLLSEASSYMNGSVIPIDGGRTTW